MGETAANTAVTTEKAAKAEKPDKLKTEYKKIVFADRQTVTKQTIAVVLSSIFLGVVIMLLDMVIKFGLGFIF